MNREILKIKTIRQNIVEGTVADDRHNTYFLETFRTKKPLSKGKSYTVTIWGSLGAGKENFFIEGENTSGVGTRLTQIGSDIFTGVLTIPDSAPVEEPLLYVYSQPDTVNTESYITDIKIEEGINENAPDDGSFHDIEITDYTVNKPRMGLMTLSASLMHGICLDDEWTGNEYVTYQGERFYIRHTPSSSKSNTDMRYKHEIEFKSESSEILPNVYFYDVVYFHNNVSVADKDISAAGDKPCSNSTTFNFYGNLREFCDRLNCAFRYAGIGDSILLRKTTLTESDNVTGDGFCAVLDSYGDYDPEAVKELSFEDQFLWDAITSAYETFEVPFEIRGKKIIFGRQVDVLDHTFEYGHNNELLTISKNNANAKVINRITFKGSSENIPYYYPNQTEYGHINLAYPEGTGNSPLYGRISIANMTQLLSGAREKDPITLGWRDPSESGSGIITTDEPKIKINGTSYKLKNMPSYSPYSLGYTFPTKTNPEAVDEDANISFKIDFTLENNASVMLQRLAGLIWIQNAGLGNGNYNKEPLKAYAEELYKGANANINLSDQIDREELTLGYLQSGEYTLILTIPVKLSYAGYRYDNVFACISEVAFSKGPDVEIEIYEPVEDDGYYWYTSTNEYKRIGELGIKFDGDITDSLIGSSFYWEASDRLPFQSNLMPPKYTRAVVQGKKVPGLIPAEERFYNALNDTYLDPDTNDYYKFKNPFIDGAPNEYVYTNEDIKPTIEGVANASGKLFGEIAAIEYDIDDNDSLASDASDDDTTDSLKYEHPYFYIRLNIFDGPYGFDLFSKAAQTDAMTLQMRSGSCNGCKFKVQALEYTDSNGLKSYKNPVQTQMADGWIVPGKYSDKVSSSNLQDWQQDTSKNQVWIALQKDSSTFGVIIPNKSHNYLPQVGDTFNIINIELPQEYIDAAEDRGEQEMLRYMADNNEEKFTFDISASRIFFAENPDIFTELDEYQKIRLRYNGKLIEQYINSITITYSNNEALPNIQIELTDELAVGESFAQNVAERAASLIANATTMGGYLGKQSSSNGTSGGMSVALAERRYVNKMKNDRTPYKIAADGGFEVGEFSSGISGGLFYINPETGLSYIEVDRMKVRMAAIFEKLTIAEVSSISGKQIISPGGSITISFVEKIYDGETLSAYRCYFKAKEEYKGATCLFEPLDFAIVQDYNIQSGTMSHAENHFLWRKITVVDNANGYIELSATDCAENSDEPQIGDVLCQLGSRSRKERNRSCAIIFSTVDEFAPSISLHTNIINYSLEGTAVIEYGVDKTKNPPQPFFNCYGRMYLGDKSGKSYLEFDNLTAQMIYKGSLALESTIGNTNIGTFIDNIANSAAGNVKDELSGQIVGENYLRNTQFNEYNNISTADDGRINNWICRGTSCITVDSSFRFEGTNTVHINTVGFTEYNYLGISQTLIVGDDIPAELLKDNGCVFSLWVYTPDLNSYNPAPPQTTLYSEIYVYGKDGALLSSNYFSLHPTVEKQWIRNELVVPKWEGESDYIQVTIYHLSQGDSYIAQPKLEIGSQATSWVPSQKDFNYLTQALKNSTYINGGLFLGTLIELGYQDTNGYNIMAGVSGLYNPNARGGGLAFWAGGNRIDADDDEANGAAFAVRHDGSAYAAKNTIRFKDNIVEVGDNVRLTKEGLHLLSDNEIKLSISNTTVGTSDDALSSITYPIVLSKNFTCTRYKGSMNLTPATPTTPTTRVSLTPVFPEMTEQYTLESDKISILSTPFANVPVNSTISLSASTSFLSTCNIVGSFDVQLVKDGQVINTYRLNVQSGKLSGIDIDDTQYRVTVNGTAVFKITEAGDYDIMCGFTPLLTSLEYDGLLTINADFDGRLNMGTFTTTLLGSDGFLSAWEKGVLFINKNAFLARVGDYGLKITESGVQIMKNKVWSNL